MMSKRAHNQGASNATFGWRVWHHLAKLHVCEVHKAFEYLEVINTVHPVFSRNWFSTWGSCPTSCLGRPDETDRVAQSSWPIVSARTSKSPLSSARVRTTCSGVKFTSSILLNLASMLVRVLLGTAWACEQIFCKYMICLSAMKTFRVMTPRIALHEHVETCKSQSFGGVPYSISSQ